MEEKETDNAVSNEPGEESASENQRNEETTESLVIEVDLSVYQLDAKKQVRGKKRSRNYINWKRYMKKIYRNSGEAYINYRGKPVAAKQVVTPLCTCQKKCEKRLTLAEKEKILSEFYAMGDKDLQDAYLNTLIIVKPVKKRRKNKPESGEASKKTRNTKKLRMFSCEYTVKTESKEFHVCKTAFCNLFAIDKSRIDLIAQKCANERDLGTGAGHKVSFRSNKMPEEVLSKIREHIRSFPYKYSEWKDRDKYSVSGSNGVRDLHVKTMYMMYLKENYPVSYSLLSKGMQAYPEVSYDCYYKCVSNFNSTFGYPWDNSNSDIFVESSQASTNKQQ